MKNKLFYGFWVAIFVWFTMSILLAFTQNGSFNPIDILFVGSAVVFLFYYPIKQKECIRWYEEAVLLFVNMGLLLIGIFQMDIQWRPGILTSTIEFSLDTLQGTALCSTELVVIFVWIFGKFFGERSNH